MNNEFFNHAAFYQYVAGIKTFQRFVEIGVYRGASCAFLGRQLLARGTPFELYAVDLWERVNAETDYDRVIDVSIWNAFIAQMRADGLETKVVPIKQESALAASHFTDCSIDFAFIDANHSYEHVKKDIQAWHPKVKQGGMLAGHDYGEPCGVKQAVDELLPNKIKLLGTCWYIFIQ